MQDLLKWISDCGFVYSTPELDGKPHRFQRDGATGRKNAWFWGVKFHLNRTGELAMIAILGDYSTGDRFEYKPSFAYSKEDQKNITEKMKEASAKAEKERERIQFEVRDEARELLAGARSEKMTKYLENKKIPSHYGAGVGRDKLQDFVAVPMRDIEGGLWGIQKIYDDGRKFFMAGQRVKNCFHMIPDDLSVKEQPVVYVCEGFATGASIYQATKNLVIVAFDAGNLVLVAQSLRKAYPEVPIVICGDDDQWKPELGNTGREKAEEAAKLSMGKVVFPKFKDESKRPTDFNDLHLLEGLDEVKSQLASVTAEKHFVRALGHGNGIYYYTSSSNKEIAAITAHSEDALLNLQKLPYWETLYPGKRGINWIGARSDLMDSCRVKGIFNPENIRGLGVWRDEGRTVVHLGDRLLVNGKEVGLHDIPSKFIYEYMPTQRSPHPSPLTQAECRPVLDVLGLLNLERPEQRFFLGGWIAAAHLCGMLTWRPHLWVTGGSGSGKSVTLNDFVRMLINPDQMPFSGGGTTEAGIRQTLRSSALPIMFDEFEMNTQQDIVRLGRCIDLLRQGSSDSSEVVKGSAGGKAMRYKTRFCAVLSSIRPQLNHEADATRFTKVELKRVENDRNQQWSDMQRALAQIDRTFYRRFHARILKMAPVFFENLGRFQKYFGEKHSQRLGDQYAPLLAGWAALVSDQVLTPEQIDELGRKVDIEQEDAAIGDSDHEAFYNTLLGLNLTVMLENNIRVERTVGQIIEQAWPKRGYGDFDKNSVYNQELSRYGLRLIADDKGYWLFVQSKNEEFAKKLRGTIWSTSWADSARRISGAIRNVSQRMFGDKRSKGTLIPLGSDKDLASVTPLFSGCQPVTRKTQ